ncbi:MAG TPA: PA domain-containing protein, partial [Myxococcaceae bacterium]|nr:PA domain-containing protein [Myxococcaceae bacterium]
MGLRLHRLTLLALAPALALAPRAGLGAEIQILNKNDSGRGFNDPTPVPPVGLNFGTTRGQQALVAFQYAATIWGATLKSDVPILIDSAFVTVADDSRLTCTTTSGIVGYARLASYASGGEYPVSGAGYPVALANALLGRDLTGGGAQIVARFNASIGTQGCLDNQSWYYGLDGRESSAQDDLVSVLLHEFGHGLGFISFVDATTGSFGSDPPAIFDFHAWDLGAGRTWDGESDATRKLLATGGNELALAGPGIATDIPRFLNFLPQLDVDVVGLPNPVPVAPADFSAPYSGGGAVVAALPIDGCSGLANEADVAGKVVLIQRGGTDPDGGLCRFWDKSNRAQDAGAAGVILFNNTPGAGLVSPTGTPALSIPVGFVTFETGSAIQAQLDGGTVNAAFGTSDARGGTDTSGNRVLLYTPSTVVSASSVSHWDTSVYPALLMEPRILHNFRQDLDLTPAVMADLGWSVVQGLSLAMVKALDQAITPGANAY